jgi:glycerol-3-phosphate dehydrogenase (NAD(P)+)
MAKSCQNNGFDGPKPGLVFLGVGAWGQALVQMARQAGTVVGALWDYHITPQLVQWYQNYPWTPNSLCDGSSAPLLSQDMAQVLGHWGRMTGSAPDVVLAVSTQAAVQTMHTMRQSGVQVGSCTIVCKGIDQASGRLICDLAQEILGGVCPIAALGGPNLAKEICQNIPAAITLACADQNTAQRLLSCWAGPRCHVQLSQDVAGVQLLGALKNVMAIGYGLLQQVYPQDNVLAAFLTAALGEMALCLPRFGGRAETTLTYAGIGDLILSSHSPSGRNSSYGRSFPKAPPGLVEGMSTLEALRRHGYLDRDKVPLMWALDQVLVGNKPLAFWAEQATHAKS